MLDMGELMWDEAVRDRTAEQAELARTAALTDAERMVWPLLSRAGDERDLEHRLALADRQLQAIAGHRGYALEELQADLSRRWQLLAEARSAVQAAEPTVEEVARQQQAYLGAVARLTAQAAADNPALPYAQCQQLAEEAVRKQADAFPLAYESWGYGGDGPFTDRAKNWQPGKMPTKPTSATPSAPSTPSGPGTEGSGSEGPASTPPTPGAPGGPEATPVQSQDGTTPHQMTIDEIDNRPRQMSLFD